MRLSEAIRLGATMKPQAFGGTFKEGGTCALGAAANAIGYDADSAVAIDWLGQWPILKRVAVSPRGLSRTIDNIIVTLNDIHHWSRERIADWVELQEIALFGPTAPEELPDPIPAPEEAPLEVA